MSATPHGRRDHPSDYDGRDHSSNYEGRSHNGHAHERSDQVHGTRDAAGHAGHAGHSHSVAADADARYLTTALCLIVGFMVIEVVFAGLSGSLALLADAGHMLVDAGALTMSLWALRLAVKPATGKWTFGFKRAEILSAAANGVTLLVVSALVTLESLRRLVSPPAVHGSTVLVISLIGVVVNLAAVWVLARANRTQLNVEGAFAHIVTDLYGFASTAVAAVVIILTGFDRADAIASLVVVGLMLRAALGLLRASGRILFEAAPESMDLDDLRNHLLSAHHVRDVHDLHVWIVTSDLPALSAHVVVEDSCFLDGHAPQVLDELQACLDGHFDVEHSTFQLEPQSHRDHEEGTHG